jgi:chromatin remodeling complex protein RSC6
MSKLAASSKKTTVKSKVSNTAEVVVPEVVVPEVVEAVVPDVVEDVVEDTMKNRFENAIKSKHDLIAQLKLEVQDLRKMQRDHEAIVKNALKKSKKRKVPRDENNPRKPSGFAAPVLVSDEMYGFLKQYGVKKGDLIARTDVTKHITAYIKEHNLQNPEFRREIQPDATLSKLLGEPVEHRDVNDESSPKVFSYLKLQKYLSQHFPKKAVA